MSKLDEQFYFIHKVMKIHMPLKCFKFKCKDNKCVELSTCGNKLAGLEEEKLEGFEDFLAEIIHERLSVVNTHVLLYLSTTYDLAVSEGDTHIKRKNANIQSFNKIFLGILLNSAYTSFKLFEKLYPLEVPKSSLVGAQYSAYKLIYFLEKTENYTFIKKIFEGNLAEDPEFLNELSDAVSTFIEYKLNDMTVVDQLSLVYIKILCRLLEIGAIQSNEIKKNLCLDTWSPMGIEQNNLFGVILTVPCLPHRNSVIINFLVSNDKVREFILLNNQNEVSQAVDRLRNMQENYIGACSDLLKLLLKQFQQETLFFIRKSVSLNNVKTKFELKTRLNTNFNLFSDNFCVNLLDFLLDLTSPIAILDEIKLEKVRKDHLMYDSELKILLATAICPSKEVVFESKEMPGTISYYFYCTLFMLRFGWTTLKKMIKFIYLLKIEQLNIDASSPAAAYYNSIINSYEAILLNDKRNSKIFNFYLVFCDLLQKWNEFSGKLPIEEPDECMKYIPEYILKDFAGFIIYLLGKNSKEIFPVNASSPVNRFLTFATFMISSPKLFQNIKLISKYVFTLNLLFKQNILKKDSDILKSNQTARRYFLSSLLRFYSDIEKYQFYGVSDAKIRFRRDSVKLLKNFLNHEYFNKQIVTLQKTEVFNKFLNFLLDEITFAYEKGIKCIESYKELFIKQKTDNSVTQLLNETKGLCITYWRMANTNLSLIVRLSDLQLEILVTDIFGRRFAAFLNQYMFKLNGPNYSKIKVEDPKAIKFKPIKALESLIKIFINLSKFPDFYTHIVGDPRFFNISVFEQTKKIIKSRILMDFNLVNNFVAFVNQLYKVSDQAIIDFDDAPDEYLCQITMELMKNPVKLPSGTVVERSNIERHLLNDKYDPFTKVEMTIQDAIEMPELKFKIQSYMNSKLIKS